MGRQWTLWLLLLVLGVLCVSVSAETRRYLVTGNWYPSDGVALNRLLDDLFHKKTSSASPGIIRGIISPHAGMVYSGECAAGAYRLVKGQKINRVILLGISHRGGFSGACVSDYLYNETPLGKIPVDVGVTAELAKEKMFVRNNRIMTYEHSIENQLPFLQRVLKGQHFKVVPVLLGRVEFPQLKDIAEIIRPHVNDRTLVVASTDFTHYGRNFGYQPFKDNIRERLTDLDMGMIEKIVGKDIDGFGLYKQRTGITMCGFKPVGVLMHLLSHRRYKVKLTDYYKSGDRSGEYDFSVSYASMVFYEEKKSPGPAGGQLSPDERKTLLSIARTALKHYFSTGAPPADLEKKFDISGRMKNVSGVFVTLKKGDRLRGCIGSLVGQDPLFQGVVTNALNAALRDPRFSPVTGRELKDLSIEISVMTPLQKIKDYRAIRLGTDGVIIRRGSHQAVYLPQVATETGWDLDRFLSNLCRKAGLPEGSYRRDGMGFYIFQAQVFGEKRHGN